MNYVLEFLKQYGFEIVFTIFSAVLAFMGTRIRAIYEEHINTKEKRQVVKDCVLMVEQVYKDIHGKEKFDKAKESIISILNEKGIAITDLEMDVLIEAAVQELNKTKEVIFDEAEGGEG